MRYNHLNKRSNLSVITMISIVLSVCISLSCFANDIYRGPMVPGSRCEVALQKAIELGEISKEMADDFKAQNWGPIFIDNNNLNEGVKLFCECAEAEKTYDNLFK